MSTAAANELIETPEEEEIEHGRRVLSNSVVVVAIRCTLQYVVLPFLLPLIGLSGAVSVWLSMALELFALGMMVFNVRRLWRTAWRWKYIGLSTLTASFLLIMLYVDVTTLLGR
ncbi:MAG: hypothetical protein IT317_00665 [Anaerolineales bacterium]|nr:hypothetical protein [Anaerolineales bacterium]